MAGRSYALPVALESSQSSSSITSVRLLGARSNTLMNAGAKALIASRQSVSKFQKSEEGVRLLATIHSVVHRLPAELVSALVKAGIRIVVIPDMDSVPRSYFNENYVDTLGLFWHERLIFIPQKFFSDGEFLNNDQVEFVALHEIGHAFDYLMGYLSETQTFKTAYSADYSRLNETEKAKISYLVEGVNRMARGQLFAETFALVYATQINVEPENRQLEWDFPTCYQFIRDRVPKFQASTSATSK